LVTSCTPFESYYRSKPDLESLKTFGSRVCVKHSGTRQAKLDRNNFTSIFLGYTSTDQNIIYLDLVSSIVKQSHHATFDEAWYLQPAWLPAAQLLYDLGLEADDLSTSAMGTAPDPSPARCPYNSIKIAPVPWPPISVLCKNMSKWHVPAGPWMRPLPLRETALPHSIAAAAARVWIQGPPANIIASDFNITKHDMAMVYMFPDLFFDSFKEDLDLRKWLYEKHHTADLSLVFHNSHLYLGGMTPGSPGAKVDWWRVNLHGAWLIKVGLSEVSSISDAQAAFQALYDSGTPSATLLFSHPKL
jgi:hypothetical protein